VVGTGILIMEPRFAAIKQNRAFIAQSHEQRFFKRTEDGLPFIAFELS